MKERYLELNSPVPIYYLGHIVQSGWDGRFYVCDRVDRPLKYKVPAFGSLEAAIFYIEERVS